ncbi:DNA mismatch repair protein MutL [Rosistilla carotiformis]|uniref:DNA mismatch repair protein MutL n=1 Tax=Rosistilla carotiformis TaxID=2528017 RepID=A0A518JLW1_9BACT|nr:DNA mismatch repair endonuclease MutL [Rosistilla carotiformis]QDV66535.1 DNA mismatch repair protein MutL [Rosistilla carotiformis]
MPTIRQLPPNLVNKIAAGEVIERPASVAKELLENSIDAGSTRIEVLLEAGGADLIRISDNGCGIDEDQMTLAVTSHATSKLPDEDSLFHVGTLGFRGEALASIASVSQMVIRSRTPEAASGSEMLIHGGVIEPLAPCGCPVGTVIEVRNLFFNTPVRRKFMRTPQTETSHIVEAFTRIALANPQVHMVLQNGNRVVHDLPATDKINERIRAFFGEEISSGLIPISGDNGEVKLTGFVCDPSVSRGNNRMQYLFLNGRHIRDRALQHALGEAFRGLLMVGRFPICFINLDMPSDLVDVNVHPTKLEVRFTESGRIYSQLLQTLRHKFLTSDLTARVGNSISSNAPTTAEPKSEAVETSNDLEQRQRQDVIQWGRSSNSTAERDLPNIRPSIRSLPGELPDFQPFPGGARAVAPARDQSDESFGIPFEPSPRLPGAEVDGGGDATQYDQDVETTRVDGLHPSKPHSHLGYQVHNRYLVTQDETGMVVVDQHALHERILYERVREKVLNGSLETQKLLVPEPVSLTSSEAATALESKDLLAQVGIEIEPFGGDTVVVSAYPAMLAKLRPEDLLRQALESLICAGKDPEVRDLLDHLLHTIACKAAIKAGDRLTSEEITSLLEQRDMYQDTHHCPHGRPTALFFSREELDRMFGRMGARKVNPTGHK